MRFTIRDILWLTALVAMGVGWWLDIRRRDSSMAETELRAANEHFKAEMVRAEVKQVRAEIEGWKKANRELDRKNDTLVTRERIREWNWRFPNQTGSRPPDFRFDQDVKELSN